MRITIAALLALLAAPALAAGTPDTSRLGHVGAGGLGRPLSPARYAALPKQNIPASAKGQATKVDALKSAERAGYKPVSELTKGAFPNFYPGLGSVYVRPSTLPVGPFLGFDRKNRLVNTVYMLSLEEMNGHKKFEATGTRTPRMNHVTVYYHGGHPGVDVPHYHYVLWHVSKKDEARVAK